MTDAEKLEVLKVLHIIQRECKKHDKCAPCTLRNDEAGGCSLSEPPDRWDLPPVPEETDNAVDE